MAINNISTAGVMETTKPIERITPVTAPDKTNDIEQNQVQKALEKNQESLTNGETEQDKLSSEDAQKLTEEMNELMDDLQTSLGFFISEDVENQIVVEIKDRNTNETIKQIPSEELLSIKKKMEEFTGLLFDQTV